MNIKDIKTVAVIGAGDMGHGIVEAAIIVGYRVFLQDINQKMVNHGVARIHESLQKRVEKSKVPAQQHEIIKSQLLHACVDLSDAVKEAVDATMRNLGFPMGPCETMDYTGLDINHHANMYFAEAVHPDFTPGRKIIEGTYR